VHGQSDAVEIELWSLDEMLLEVWLCLVQNVVFGEEVLVVDVEKALLYDPVDVELGYAFLDEMIKHLNDPVDFRVFLEFLKKKFFLDGFQR